jgi:hypothetical protein
MAPTAPPPPPGTASWAGPRRLTAPPPPPPPQELQFGQATASGFRLGPIELEPEPAPAPAPEGAERAAAPPSPYRGVSVYNTANANSVADTISAMKARMSTEEPQPG